MMLPPDVAANHSCSPSSPRDYWQSAAGHTNRRRSGRRTENSKLHAKATTLYGIDASARGDSGRRIALIFLGPSLFAQKLLAQTSSTILVVHILVVWRATT